MSDSLRPHGLVAYQAPPSMGFSRQEYWSGLPFPSPGDLPDPGIEPGSPSFQADALTSEPPGKVSYDTSLCEIPNEDNGSNPICKTSIVCQYQNKLRLVFKNTSYTGGEEMGKFSSHWLPSFWGNFLFFSLILRYFRVQFSTNALPLSGVKDDLIHLIISPYIGKMVRPSIYNFSLAYLDTKRLLSFSHVI